MSNATRPLSASIAPTIQCRILRSPSHDSVTTDLSLLSVSTHTAEAINCSNHQLGGGADAKSKHNNRVHRSDRGSSPNPDNCNLLRLNSR